MVHVTNRTDVHVGFASYELFFSHVAFLFSRLLVFYSFKLEPLTGFEPVTSSLPRTRSTD